MGRKKKTQAEEQNPELLEHIQGLGLKSVREYREWCDENGFSRKLKKHWTQRCRERFHQREALAKTRLVQKKREKRRFAQVLDGICRGHLDADDVTQPELQRLCQALQPGGGPRHERGIDRKVLLRLLTHVHRERARFFGSAQVLADRGDSPGNTYVEALALIAAHYPSWLRPIDAWKPRTHSAPRQFASLVRHLFVRYEMPVFFDAVWFAGPEQEAAVHRRWYLHVGRGLNIRTCDLPVRFTKKMAHHFLRAPADATVAQALRWGQVFGLGGDERLARALFGTRLVSCFENDDFWASVIRWLIAHPSVDRTQIRPLIDFLQQQKFVRQRCFEPGRPELGPPPQPGLCMKGRTPEALLRQMEDWHGRLAMADRHPVRQWKSSGIDDFEFEEGARENHSLKYWTIRELLSSKALLAEGRRMKHCVASYVQSCTNGHSSIWALEVESFEGRAKAVTIEVRNPSREVCQVRGKKNRLPTEKELSVIRRWAAREGLTVNRHL